MTAPVPVAVVTGASRGLGRGIAVALATAGCDVVVGYHADAAGAETTADAVRATGRSALTVAGDVADVTTSAALLDAATHALGSLDVWVNNAGVSTLAPVVDTKVDELTRMIDVNLVGTFHGVQAAARWFLDAGRPGRIINVASELGVQAFKYLGAYSATKFGVVGLTQAAGIADNQRPATLVNIGVTKAFDNDLRPNARSVAHRDANYWRRHVMILLSAVPARAQVPVRSRTRRLW